MGALLGKSLAVAAAQIAAGMGMQLGAGALIGMAAIPTALGILVGSVSQIGSAQEGGFTGTEGLLNVHPNELITPIDKLADFLEDAMKPLVEATDRATKSNERALAEVGGKVDSQATRFADAVEGMA